MINSTSVVPVNPRGESPLTREQLWKGLVLKARDARLFLPQGACTRCEVIVDATGYLIREATIFGDELSEIVTFEPQKKVSFFQRTGRLEGVIVNEIQEDKGGELSLRFYCLLALRDKEAGGTEEKDEQIKLDSEDRGYRAALLSTLARTRKLVHEGQF
ncbi:hypothetical protein GCM10027093_73840 [Paraburkholderia jirisanensis]